MKQLIMKNISKSYGPVHALNRVHLNFSENGIYGLYGRNGAGKTTLLNILSSRIFADTGTVTWDGRDVVRHPEKIAASCCYMPEKHLFPGGFKISRLLSLAQQAFPDYSKQTETRLCRAFHLNTGLRYNQLSGGFQSIFRIVLGLASNAPITLFDEPVLGLDAVSRDRFYQELIHAFSEHPRLFIISTHLISESADLFNEAVIIHNGEILRQAPVEALLSNAFYVSGRASDVNTFLKDRTVLGSQDVNDLKTAVVEGNLHTEKPIPGLQFSSLTIQKLFIQLTADPGGQESDHE